MPALDHILREAYAAGWAASGGPMTERVRTGCTAAVRTGLAHVDDPYVVEATLRIGHLEGVWAAIFERRLKLHDSNDADLLAAWRDLTDGFDVAPLVRAAAAEPAVEADGALQAHIADLAGKAATLLRRLVASPVWQAMRTKVRDALARGQAEGRTDALALAADKLGRVGFGFDIAFNDAYKALEDAGELLTEADTWMAKALADQGKVIGTKLAQMARDGAGAQDMSAAVKDLMAQGAPVRKVIDQLTSRAMSKGALDLYRSEGVKLVDFVTAADQQVCQICSDAEANGPYAPNDAPVPGLHPGCRCALAAEDPIGLGKTPDYSGPATPSGNSAVAIAAANSALRRHIGTGISEVRTLGGGASARTDLVTFEDGTQAVRKIAKDFDEAADAADAEDLASTFGRALSLPLPEVVKDGTTVYMGYVADAVTGADRFPSLGYGGPGAEPDAVALANSVQGRKLGLFDLVTGNVDRNDGNWLLDSDGTLIGIDHGFAFTAYERTMATDTDVDLTGELLASVAAPNNLFANQLLQIGDDEIGGSRGYTTGDLDHVKAILTGLRQQFVDAGRLSWYEASLTRIAWLRPHAGDGAPLWP